MLLITATILFLTIATAAPAANEDYCRTKKSMYIAQYDDLPYVEPGPNPIPPGYNGLDYTTFQVDRAGFIPASSGSQWAMAFGGSGNVSVPAYPPTQTFSLDSFSYACVSGIPQPECAISIWGWKINGRLIKRVITYPRLDPGHVAEDFKMNATTFSSEWKNLKSVGFSIARKDNGGDMFGGLALDDVKYTVTTEC